MLKAAIQDSDKVVEMLEGVIHELKVAMFLTGAKNVSEFKRQEVVVTGKTREWLEQVGKR